ncbi:MAG: hypothetical protein JWN03_273 [Nocardia sp.]|nr:hypothetical protein [Nocardia sp.]
MPIVEIDPQYTSGLDSGERNGRSRREAPGGIQVPASAGRVVHDVVPNGTVAANPITPLLVPMMERHRGINAQVRSEPISQGSGNFDLQLPRLPV